MENMIAVIMGGGAGTRLFPLTNDRAKPAVPLAGKYRLVDVPISNCINSGIYQIFVLTQYNSASLNNHIARSYIFDRFRGGFVTLLAAEQTATSEMWYQGTADAVRQSMLHIRSYPHDEIIILSGDQLYSMDYRAMQAHHEEMNAEITIAATPVVAREAPAFGILKTDEKSRITEFYEKPKIDQLQGKESPVAPELNAAGRIYMASMGIYIFDADVLREVLDANPTQHDFGKQIIPGAIRERRVFAYPFTGYWNDIGTVRSFFETNIMLAQPKPPFNLYDPGMPLYTNARMLPPAKITRSQIENSIVGEGSVIVDSQISSSVVGIRTYIGRGTRINRTVLLGADYWGWQRSEGRFPSQGPPRPGITNRNKIQEWEGPGFYIRDGIVVILKNAVIPGGTVI
jgi:glucose-1-phosphate adenylyltransferase